MMKTLTSKYVYVQLCPGGMYHISDISDFRVRAEYFLTSLQHMLKYLTPGTIITAYLDDCTAHITWQYRV